MVRNKIEINYNEKTEAGLFGFALRNACSFKNPDVNFFFFYLACKAGKSQFPFLNSFKVICSPDFQYLIYPKGTMRGSMVCWKEHLFKRPFVVNITPNNVFNVYLTYRHL